MPTKEEFESYKEVQKTGMFNMVTQWFLAAHYANLDQETYWQIIKNYNALAEKYGRD